ncbi:hypothetical protein [Pasteuria penetrans]|uniref:hypothetical protein n=1 Tax=Pasteuria penetrans TaxID=86005 RepID=UPI000F989BE6|nr:hypothetical protein [Pasteuria penetrans]
MTNLSRGDMIRQCLSLLILLFTTILSPVSPFHVHTPVTPPPTQSAENHNSPAPPPDIAQALAQTFAAWTFSLLDGAYANLAQQHRTILEEIFKKFGKIPPADTFYRQLLVHRVDPNEAYRLRQAVELLLATIDQKEKNCQSP